METLGDFVYRMRKKSDRSILNLISDLNITRQYLNDIENNKRTPSTKLLKKMIDIFKLNESDAMKLYDLASSSYKKQKVPADIEEFIINNDNVKENIRKIMKGYNN